MSDLDPQVLLGQRENGRLEFKDAEVMRRPVKIAREVVGFLNADGGDVWIGVKEGGQGRAVELQPLDRPEVARRSILDHLVGVIEPSFTQEEVAVTCVGGLIQVTVKKGAHPPYAVRDGGRHFLTRIDDRLNEMTREQIREAFSKSGEDTEHDKAATKAKLRERVELAALKKGQLWLGLTPAEKLTIAFDDGGTQQLFRTWFAEPHATGNRESGWNFVSDPILQWPRFFPDRLDFGQDADGVKMTISECGELTFVAELSLLSAHSPLEKKQLEPYALLEYPVSVFRLMGKILDRFGGNRSGSTVYAAFSMKGIAGWTLSPGSRREPMRRLGPRTFERDVQIDPERLELDAQMLAKYPDRCALRLIRLIYGELGFESDAIPREFDQQRGVLSIG